MRSSIMALTGLAALAVLGASAGQAAPNGAAAGHPAATASRHSAAQTKAAVEAAIANPARADQAGDDARRQTAASLEFSGVGPGDSVVDFLPGSGYWTRLFTSAVGPSGHVDAMWLGSADKPEPQSLTALKARNLANVTAERQTGGLPSVAAPVDLFWTVQNYHDIANEGGADHLAAFNKAVFAALKPGGTYLIIDHAAPAGSGLADTSTLHRIDPATVKSEVIAAGFTFVGSSDALRNPADDHTKKVFDPAIRGHTDQFIYKFRKPG